MLSKFTRLYGRIETAIQNAQAEGPSTFDSADDLVNRILKVDPKIMPRTFDRAMFTLFCERYAVEKKYLLPRAGLKSKPLPDTVKVFSLTPAQAAKKQMARVGPRDDDDDDALDDDDAFDLRGSVQIILDMLRAMPDVPKDATAAAAALLQVDPALEEKVGGVLEFQDVVQAALDALAESGAGMALSLNGPAMSNDEGEELANSQIEKRAPRIASAQFSTVLNAPPATSEAEAKHFDELADMQTEKLGRLRPKRTELRGEQAFLAGLSPEKRAELQGIFDEHPELNGADARAQDEFIADCIIQQAKRQLAKNRQYA